MTGPLTAPASEYVTVGPHQMHVTRWGRPDAPPLVMWHGLARTGRDFDVIAAALSDRYHVICPDTIGRGLSEWSADPDRDYCFAAYAAQAAGCSTYSACGRCCGSAPRWAVLSASRPARRRCAGGSRGWC